ncbi:MAG: hypothetical protein JKY66_01320 [Spongiibacteraceae bacterium]|nr:hypothetical protein [Spongiibacteraceae bacterium]
MRGLGADDEYWASLSKGQLSMQQCQGCDKWNWPAVWRCGECGSWEHQWQATEMQGSVYSWSRTWHEFGAPKELKLPFVSVVVELNSAGNRRLLGVLKQPDKDVSIGGTVTGQVINVSFSGENIPVIQWQLSE